MTDKQIIKEKGNQKCIFYNDDICRKGDKTRDCLNCARVEYHSLYKLNWENQERLESQLEAKEQECEGLKEAQKNSRCAWKSFEGTFCPEAQEQLEAYKMEADEGKEINAELKAENEELKRQHQSDKGLITSTGKMNYQLLQEYDQLKAENKHLNDLLNQALKELEAIQDAYEERE